MGELKVIQILQNSQSYIFSCNFTSSSMLFQAVVTRPSNVILGSRESLSSSEYII